MQDYIIVTDATCDLPVDIIKSLGVIVLPMEFIIDDKSYSHHPDERNMSFHDFYNYLRVGKMSTTSQINYNTYRSVFSGILNQGKDILYISFSSGLSGTYNASRLVINELEEEFPDRKILSVDSLSASIGEGLLVYLAALKKQQESTLEELIQWVEDMRFQVCHWFAVDDLEHLKRGGRINAVQASVGSILNLKPILSVNREGKLVTIAKVRGKKKSYQYLIQKLKDDGIDTNCQNIIVGHADCEEDAICLKGLILNEGLAKEVLISNIGPIIGTHTGAGMLAVTFIGKRQDN
ncbi:DegV family protein [Clostridium tunisiense]|uniref:DegV family protein n=1 Tax=Clostridium tunisiense TaxID=219748 RepID=UPI0002DF9056|nr:DegV family protein [Clostridium tunisiense]